MIYLVTRHQGAVEWCARHKITVDACLPHLDVETIQAGDTVIGTLPIPLAAAVAARGGHYWHLTVPVTWAQRGQELTATQLEDMGASLQAYHVTAAE
ncbi:putative CRISPR-associated protein [Salinivibrio sp. PR932]|uniref:CRISPR-associated protein Csx16 n=1 Tax=Salinivibrio sp. PR932 TaxID=1909492 RepID=UPI0009898768|nr:CRISPR-associated protein Csx16 [Salinivibrio sp. PR932]OOF17858.1 putative CRISPR-associated protein [Salinivibrio sp. PR932]